MNPDSNTPVLLPYPVALTPIAARHPHTLALDTQGQVFAFGLRHHGQGGPAITRVGVDPDSGYQVTLQPQVALKIGGRGYPMAKGKVISHGVEVLALCRFSSGTTYLTEPEAEPHTGGGKTLAAMAAIQRVTGQSMTITAEDNSDRETGAEIAIRITLEVQDLPLPTLSRCYPHTHQSRLRLPSDGYGVEV